MKAMERNITTKTASQTALALLFLLACAACNRSEQPAAETAGTPAATNAPAPAAVKSEYLKLKGNWERPDGGYVLQIRDVAADGKLDAGYFNPSPINIARAVVYTEGGQIKVYVELRDANYPGCVYRLTYDPKADQLYGTYFQASMGQTYDITFARLKEQ